MILFNIIINNVFKQIKEDIGRSLYVDNGAIWKRGHNIKHVTKVIHTAVNEVENWSNSFRLKLSVARTQVVCFTKRSHVLEINVKLYGQILEQVPVIRYLGV